MKPPTLIGLLFCSAPLLFGQDASKKGELYPKVSLSLYTVMWGVSGLNTVPQSEVRLDITRGRKIYFLCTFYGGYFFQGTPSDASIKSWHIGMQFGMGGYLFNKRSEQTGRGWAGVLNGGFGIGILFNSFSPEVEAKRQAYLKNPGFFDSLLAVTSMGFSMLPIMVPCDLQLTFEPHNYYRYYAAANFGIQIGLHFGMGVSSITFSNLSGSPYGFTRQDFGLSLRYGVSFGFLF